jgi:HlyD family secretion protein
MILKSLAVMLAALFLWSALGQLEIVAVAEGRLVPQSFLKIVQPAEAGIVSEILVKEGDQVRAGQVLMRMDTVMSEADSLSLQTDADRKAMTLRRIDAELTEQDFTEEPDDPRDLFLEVRAQFIADKAALAASLAEEASRLEQARKQLLAGREVKAKLEGVLPFYRSQAHAYQELASGGYVGSLEAQDKRREWVEKEQELRSQEHILRSIEASVAESQKKMAQIAAEYRRNLHAERNEVQGQLDKLTQEIAKQRRRRELLELRAPGAGVVKDLATHTAGTVTQPGTVLLTLVPLDEKLYAEVWLTNQDRGFVRPGQTARLKLAPFPFQKYGTIQGNVETVSADASDITPTGQQTRPPQTSAELPASYKTMLSLESMTIDAEGHPQPLEAGMQVNAEIIIGRRTVLEYLLSPVKKVLHEAGTER